MTNRERPETSAAPEGEQGAETPIPDKAYFRIGEVARILGVQPYVLRYWESEFGAIRPQKTRSQQRLYRRRDVELLQKIKRLLYVERYTIEGARKRLRGPEADEPEPEPRQQPAVGGDTAEKLKEELREILKLVEE